MQIVEGDDAFYAPKVPNGSMSRAFHYSPMFCVDSISRKSFSYNKLPQEPHRLTVLKLDGSSFEIQVAKNGTVKELKQAVEAAFSHLPKTGPGRVSWPHVWGQFCLSYNSHKLLNDSSYLGIYKIKDGDQLCFIRHSSINYNLARMQSEKEDSDLDDKPDEDRQENSRGSLKPYKREMANMIMASSKAPITSTPSTSSTPGFKVLPKIALPRIPKPHQLLSLTPSSFKSISVILAATSFSLSQAPPSLAEEFEKAALFDFNLTLPIIVAEFLFLMFALDKIYYSPLGNFMDQRDAAIREKLSSVKDTSAEVKQLEDQAAAVLRAARAEISAALNKMKKETQLEVEQKLAEGRKKLEAELQEALANLDKQKEDTLKALDSQIAALSEDIVKKVLPVS
ncbi:unnamed protein product [Fraxinus pennsylvanica]|uniref:SNRNP25 ubiquitin-like domain-containing protein n=1 Tax=Fraxinus pennsylvanica TaxID=56036 RepID=A0AAD2DKS9_9LAMI|nr:unnamed protein product [Fraxinus pennsylvanica]